MLNPQNVQNGQEQHEEYYSNIARKYKVQYDYRDTNGKLFSCIRNTLAECRIARDLWLEKK